VLLPLALAGCSGGGAGQAAEEAATLAGGAQLAAELGASGAVPRLYCGQVTEKLAGELRKLKPQLARDGVAAREADDLSRVLGRIQAAARQGDRTALRREAAQAGALQRHLTAAAERLDQAEGGS
jgi:hypothetical protein